ncbi:hypothetical protein DS884_07710 [Tenacibaculum sp. E3R01]|nr:hypothetical protein DS884_07710 [Tenacibaculum sp. E3R01]
MYGIIIADIKKRSAPKIIPLVMLFFILFNQFYANLLCFFEKKNYFPTKDNTFKNGISIELLKTLRNIKLKSVFLNPLKKWLCLKIYF